METVCGILESGQDISCDGLEKSYAQRLVILNSSHLKSKTVTTTCENETNVYTVEFELQEDKKGVMFIGIPAGNDIRGITNKSRTDRGRVQYQHQVNMLVAGINQKQKCILSSLDKGSFFAVLEIRNPETLDVGYEVFGIEQFLITDDYEYDPAENAGIVEITLQSHEDFQEDNLPYIYKAGDGSTAKADFESLFLNPA